MNDLSMGMGNLSGSAIEYPTMIFDGPFSTALETKEVKGLKGESVSKEQAQKYLQEKVFKSRNLKIKNSNETNGDLATFDFLVEVEDRDYSVQISKVGSLLITISGFAEGGDAIVGVENAIEMAETFANNVGFRNMQSVWKEVENNVAYINLAPVVENVIYYPDLVKVKVDLTSNNIIGFEAVNYALNNVEREFNAVLSFEDAEQKLGFDYEIINSNKAIIKLDSGK